MRILLSDDHAIVRRGLQMVLSLEKDFEIVGEASDGAQAIQLADELRPDLILMDLKMQRVGGSAATRSIKQAHPEIRILILTGVDVDVEASAALEAGADGYVLKDVSPDELIRAIRVVAAGEAYLQPAVTRRLIQRLQGGSASADKALKRPGLTARECQVLQLMATTATYKEIAAQLVIAEETVRSHAKSILSKLEQPNRTQAVIIALREGLITLD